MCMLRDGFPKKDCCSFGFCTNYLPPDNATLNLNLGFNSNFGHIHDYKGLV